MKHYFELYDDEFWLNKCMNDDTYLIDWDDRHVYVKDVKLNKIIHLFHDDIHWFCKGLLTKLNIETR